MRYILNSEGYIYDIAFGTEIECDLGTSILYAGEVPTGYSTLEEWHDGEIDKLNAWKIVDGNLVFDNARYNELQSEWEKEATENKQIVKKDLKNIEQMLTSVSDTNKSQYVSDSTDGKIITVSNASNIFPSVKVTDIDPYSYNKLDFIITGKNMLKNDATSKELNGMSFTQNADRSITINGTATSDIEYNIGGTSLNTSPFLCFKKDKNYYLSGLENITLKMYYYNGTDRTEVYSGTDGIITFTDSDKLVTQIVLSIPNETTINNVTIYPQLEYGSVSSDYEKYKGTPIFTFDFTDYIKDGLFPSDELFPSDSLYPQGTTISYIDVSNNEIKAFINDNMEYLGEGNIPIFEGCNTLYTLQDTFLHYEYSTNVLIYNPSRYGANEENPTLKSSYHYKDEWEVDGTTYTEEYTDDARFFSNGLKFVEDWSNDYPESTGYGKWKNIIELYNDYKFPFFELRKELDTGYWNSTTISPSGIDITDSENISYNSSTHIYRSGITTPTVTQTSLKESKKNFEKLNNALEIIKDTDIYKYNLKYENDDDKKHIGFVIGDDFKYSKEITSLNNDGVDIYSMISVCFKAIQEQQMIIEKLENKIKELEVK